MSETHPIETLNPLPMDNVNSSEQPKSPEKNAHSDKRKREEPLLDQDQSQQQDSMWKTSLCSYFRKSNGSCSHGDSCRYAHGEEELRPRPDNTWDPTSERAKKMAKTYAKENKELRKEGGIMMTEALGEEGEETSSGLSKCLVNLPMKWSADNLRSFLREQGIQFESAKKKKGMIVGFVTFGNAAQVKTAVEELDGKTVGNNRTLKVSDVIPRSFEKKSKIAYPHVSQQMEQQSPVSEQPSVTNSVNDNEADDDDSSVPNGVLEGRSARNVVTPLADMSYPCQLEHKKYSLMGTLKKLTRNVRKACPDGISLPEWILKSREIGGLPCGFDGIVESPLVNGYRNKCEFSVGYSLEGTLTVGFLLGNFREGVTAVEEPADCPNVSRIACKYAKIFEEFLQHSHFPVWNRLNNTGFWRQLTVREGRMCKTAEVVNAETNISEVLLIVQVCSVGSDDGQVEAEIESMAQAFSIGSNTESPPVPLTTLVIQDHTGISNAAPADAPLRYVFTPREGDSGLYRANDVVEPRIHDHIGNLKFSISPSAFFQVNTLAAEKLYSLAGDWAGLGPDTLLFDICCGTGTIGLTLAQHVGMVVGIEMNASAVSDAQRNAEMNCIKNCRFICGKAENVIGSLMKEYISLTKKQDASDIISQNEPEIIVAGEKINPLDPVLGTKDELDPGNDNSGTECPTDETRLQEHHTMGSSSVPEQQQFKNIVAIVDPPRGGLHPTVIKVLRTQSQLRRLVYISCIPESLVANAIELCTPSVDKATKGKNKNNRGWKHMSSASLARHRTKSMPNSDPFKPVKAVAVDLFPHTPHCELVMLFER